MLTNGAHAEFMNSAGRPYKLPTGQINDLTQQAVLSPEEAFRGIPFVFISPHLLNTNGSKGFSVYTGNAVYSIWAIFDGE